MHLYNSRLQSLEKIIYSLNERINNLNKRSDRYSVYRLLIFSAGALISLTGYFFSNEAGWIITVISVAAFSLIVHLHNRLIEGIRKCHTYLNIKEENLARMKLQWNKIPDPIANTPAEEMTIEKDLDLFGKYSLHNLLDVSISFEGSLKLREWLTNSNPDKNSIIEKQNIVKELAGLDKFRDRFLLKARLVSKRYLDCTGILNWIGNSENIQLSKWVFPICSALIVMYILLFALSIAGIVQPYWILIFIIYFFIYSSQQKKIGSIIEESLGMENQMKKLSAMIFYVENYSFAKHPNTGKFLSLFVNDGNAAFELKHLQKIISALIIRENPIIRIMLNIVFPYDIFYSGKLIRVKSEIKKSIHQWIEKLNELECFISIANFSFINPDYIFPEIADTENNVFEAKSLGHPLIKRETKVCNDFSFEKENEIVIITGSNMSGKSTFLRAAGINICLAGAGAAVNAGKFRISLYELFTCIKVTDSVIDGISYFYAEVRRLKQLLDELENESGMKKLFLIDEIFKGTNNKERLIGSRSYIKKLSELKGTGFISTHDLELIKLESEISSIENYHFREDIVNGKMVFDYKIHTGPCPTTNALKIMELSGLPVD